MPGPERNTRYAWTHCGVDMVVGEVLASGSCALCFATSGFGCREIVTYWLNDLVCCVALLTGRHTRGLIYWYEVVVDSSYAGSAL
jgi:hypothetical protein